MFPFLIKKIQLVAMDTLSSESNGGERWYYSDESTWDEAAAGREAYAYVRCVGRGGSGTAKVAVKGERGVDDRMFSEFVDTATPPVAEKILGWTTADAGFYIGKSMNTFNFGPKVRFAVGIKDNGGAALATATIEAWVVLRA